MPKMPVEPMLCQPGTAEDLAAIDRVLVGQHPKTWVCEAKVDGQRCIAERKDDEVRLWSRRGRLITKQFPEIAEQLEDIDGEFVLDGEIAVFRGEEKGPMFDFEKLVKRANTTDPLSIRLLAERHPAVFCMFDAPLVAGNLHQRRVFVKMIRRRLGEQGRMSIDTIEAAGGLFGILGASTCSAYFEDAVRNGLEGIVVKNILSGYQPGKRSRDWMKFKKTDTVDVEIVGLTESDAGLPFGAMVMVKDGKYFGKVGTGFSDLERKMVLQMVEGTVTSPVDLPNEVMAEVLTFCRPWKAEIVLMGETGTGLARHPVFVRRRAD